MTTKRRVWPWAVVLVVAVAVLADLGLRAYTASRISAQIKEATTSSNDVKVHLGGFAIIPQLITGKLEKVTVTADELSVEGYELSTVYAEASGVSMESPTLIRQLDATAIVPLTVVTDRYPILEITTLGPKLAASLAIAPGLATVTWELSAAGDQIILTVDAVRLGPVDLPLDVLPLDWLTDFATMRVQVPLPTGMNLTGVMVTDAGLRVTVDGTWIQFP